MAILEFLVTQEDQVIVDILPHQDFLVLQVIVDILPHQDFLEYQDIPVIVE